MPWAGRSARAAPLLGAPTYSANGGNDHEIAPNQRLGRGALRATGPLTAYVYDWIMLPIGLLLWLKELETYIAFPPLQSPESYNLTQVMEQVRQARHGSPAGD